MVMKPRCWARPRILTFSMGFACGSADPTALLMGNTLFGGSSNSKLFLNVREKLSLCYFASSMVKPEQSKPLGEEPP